MASSTRSSPRPNRRPKNPPPIHIATRLPGRYCAGVKPKGFLVIPVTFAVLGGIAVSVVIVTVVRSARLPSELNSNTGGGAYAGQRR